MMKGKIKVILPVDMMDGSWTKKRRSKADLAFFSINFIFAAPIVFSISSQIVIVNPISVGVENIHVLMAWGLGDVTKICQDD